MRSGERRGGVTGVQTCALPIYNVHCPPQYLAGRDQLFRTSARERADLTELRLKARPKSHAIGRASGGGDWSSDVCSSDLQRALPTAISRRARPAVPHQRARARRSDRAAAEGAAEVACDRESVGGG